MMSFIELDLSLCTRKKVLPYVYTLSNVMSIPYKAWCDCPSLAARNATVGDTSMMVTSLSGP